MSLRVEKGYGSLGRDYSPGYWPQETGFARLIKMDKEFLNKSAYAAIADKPARELLRTLVIEATTADATGKEPIFDLSGAPAGKASSWAYATTSTNRAPWPIYGPISRRGRSWRS